MKTKINFAIIILMVLIAQSCSNKKVKNDWIKDNLKGKVRSYSESSYEAVYRFGKIEKSSFKNKYTYKYDENGNMIEKNWYKSDGKLSSKWTYKFDENGYMIEKNQFNSDGSLDWKGIYKYDENGNQTDKSSYNSDDILYKKYIYEFDKYDNQGNWIKKIDYVDGTPKNIVERGYEYYD